MLDKVKLALRLNGTAYLTTKFKIIIKLPRIADLRLVGINVPAECGIVQRNAGRSPFRSGDCALRESRRLGFSGEGEALPQRIRLFEVRLVADR